ncbi:phage holin family protein [Celeribacter indicus]|uniref:Uncharacterized protein n=1 Tax=Celeribacter indicus TaxID=1208324 RepID=A0A0B5DYH3_9RHOB|nr:phage holin family protein [Celeribacter indicus]AJE46205.1 hypothetical protein P73_1490 [Celeribacter indicus]SDW49941.1 Putative Holin-X, holin superfamily III [Celeribacter indicus]
MITALSLTLRRAARRAALSATAAAFLLVGLVFLTVSAFSALLLVTTLPIAALIVGGAYFGVGLVLLAIATPPPPAIPPVPAAPPADPYRGDMLTEAFLQGMETGATVRRTLRR